jgi:hypothetical protein
MKSIPWDGKPISKPGMYSGIPNHIYHGNCCEGHSVSTTGLKRLFHESPAKYWVKSFLNPKKKDDDESSALIFGRAIHHLILGEPNFQQHFAEEPLTYEDPKTGEVKKWSNNSNECKRWNDLRAKEGRYILTKAEINHIRGIATAIHADDPVYQDLLGGMVERSLFWKDKKTGIWCKLRPDVIPTASGDVVDLKTTTSVDWDDLENSLFKFGYYQQGAMNREGLKQVLDIDMTSFTLFFVEKDEPYSPRPTIIKDIDIEIGSLCNRAALDMLAGCLKENIWPGPRGLAGQVVEHLEMRAYHKNRICTKLALLGYETPDYEGKSPEAIRR